MHKGVMRRSKNFLRHCEVTWIDSALSLVKIPCENLGTSGLRINAGEKYPAGIYLFKVNNRNKRKRCEICSS